MGFDWKKFTEKFRQPIGQYLCAGCKNIFIMHSLLQAPRSIGRDKYCADCSEKRRLD